MVLRSLARRSASSRGELEVAWQHLSSGVGVVPGPVGIVWKQVESLGWSWNEFLSFGRGGLPGLSLVGEDDDAWGHAVRQAARMMMWKRAVRRPDMAGVERGIDRRATLSLMGSSDISAKQKGILRGIRRRLSRNQGRCRLYTNGI